MGNAKLWVPTMVAAAKAFTPWDEPHALEPEKLRAPSREYLERLTEWRALCTKAGTTFLDETFVRPSVVQHVRRFAIESGETEKLYALAEQSKARAIVEGIECLTQWNQKPEPGVPRLTAKQLVDCICDQERGVNMRNYVAKSAERLTPAAPAGRAGSTPPASVPGSRYGAATPAAPGVLA